MNGAQQTALYTIDTLTRRFNLQQPPNDGVQQPRGELAASCRPASPSTSCPTAQGGNMTFLLAAGTLHTVNLDTGMATATGAVTGLPGAEVIDIAAMR